MKKTTVIPLLVLVFAAGLLFVNYITQDIVDTHIGITGRAVAIDEILDERIYDSETPETPSESMDRQEEEDESPDYSFPSAQDLKCKDCNVLLIIIDTLRADHLSCYGHDRDTSPNIDRFAEGAVIFNNNFCHIPFTPPSTTSILTGLYPHTHNAFMLNRSATDERINDSDILPKMLSMHGYKTGGFLSSRMVRFLEKSFDDSAVNEEGKFYRDELVPEDKKKAGFNKTTEEALSWLDKNHEEKFFLLVHYWDVHAPYRPIEEFDLFTTGNESRGEKQSVKYDGEIRFVDHKIDMIMDKIDTLGVSDNTIVIITSDHGEAFGEYDCKDFWQDRKGHHHDVDPYGAGVQIIGRGQGGGMPCKGHYNSLHRPEIYTPLIIRVPGDRGGREVDSITQSVDLYPTIFELLDLPLDHDIDGKSLVPLMTGEKREHDFTFSELRKRGAGFFATSIKTPEWKLIQIERKTSNVTRLYNSNEKKKDVASENAEIVEFLSDEIYNILEGKDLELEEPDEETEKMLRSLGYLH